MFGYERAKEVATWGARAFATRLTSALPNTFFLDDSVNGDGIEQVDDRVVAGAALWGERLTRLFGIDGTWRGTVGGRWDDATVGLFAARDRARIGTKTDDRVRIHNVYAALDRTLALGSHARATLGVRADGFRFDVSDRIGDSVFAPAGTEA